MSVPLRVLIIEDSENDTLLIIEELREDGYDPLYERVDTHQSLETALDKAEWDVIIADYRMPAFTGTEALNIVRERDADIPFIIVSGKISEETAVDAMKAGANDYVLKDNLARLAPAVERELRDARIRRENAKVVKERERLSKLLGLLLESTDQGIFGLDKEGHCTFINKAAAEAIGYSPEKVIGKNTHSLFHHHHHDSSVYPITECPVYNALKSAEGTRVDNEVLWRSDGKPFPVEYSAFPIRDNGDVIGVVVTFYDITKRKQNEEALERALDDAKRESKRAYALESIAEAGISTTDMQEFLDILTRRMAEILHTHSSTLWMLDEKNHEFVASAECGAPGTIGTKLRIDEGIAGIIYNERRPVYTGDAEHDPLVLDELLKRHDIKSLLSVPLITRGYVVGMARVDMTEVRKFTKEEIGLMEAMASRAAQAIDNIKLYDDLTKSRNELAESLERERQFSLLLQKALLPDIPSLDSDYNVAAEYVPAFISRKIGGDFYDVFQVGDEKAGVLIGDVSGKGLEAAAMAATTRSTIHAFVHETFSSAEALCKTNAVLYSSRSAFDSFATVFLVILDLKSGDITYSNAGHPPSLICRRNNTLEVLEFGDVPLAVLEEQQFIEHHTRLDPGDTLVMYTDGISEARRGSNTLDVKGVEHLIDRYSNLPPDKLIQIIINAATDWAGGKLQDDAAVVVVERLHSEPISS